MTRKFSSAAILKRVVPVLLLGLLALGLVLYIPPTNLFIIACFIVLISLIGFLLSSFFVSKKFQYLTALFIFMLLGILYFVGFDILNILLLVGLFGSIGYLIK